VTPEVDRAGLSVTALVAVPGAVPARLCPAGTATVARSSSEMTAVREFTQASASSASGSPARSAEVPAQLQPQLRRRHAAVAASSTGEERCKGIR